MLYDGLRVLGGGSILGGLILGAIATFIIDRDFKNASSFALAGALLTFFGFMHGERIGIAQTPTVAAAYLVIAILFIACAKYAVQEHTDGRRRRMPRSTRRKWKRGP